MQTFCWQNKTETSNIHAEVVKIKKFTLLLCIAIYSNFLCITVWVHSEYWHLEYVEITFIGAVKNEISYNNIGKNTLLISSYLCIAPAQYKLKYQMAWLSSKQGKWLLIFQIFPFSDFNVKVLNSQQNFLLSADV